MTAAMALRTSSIPSSSTTPAAPADWRGRVELAVTVAAARLTAADLPGLAAVFADVSGWEDRQRAYQARCRLAELVLAYRPADADAWVAAFITGAGCLLDALEQEPREPVLLNHTGVLLYELCEAGAAADIFRAALRLDPEHAHTASNLDHARARARSNARLPGVLATRTRGLAARARKVAARAKAAKALTLSLCMIVKDEEEMLPGCLEPLRGVVDEMIVVDTGSTDRTVEIAESFGATVVHFPWNGSFADARNASIEAASGDWLIYLDADEHMEAADARMLRGLLGAHVARGLLPRRDELHRRLRGRVGRHPHGASDLAQPAAVPVHRPHPRAEDPHDADLPARALRGDPDPGAPLRLPEPAHRLQGQVPPEHPAARAGGAGGAHAVHRLQPRLGVPRPR